MVEKGLDQARLVLTIAATGGRMQARPEHPGPVPDVEDGE
jgi:hypothetical protein